jgi:hypothetical protein
MPSNAHEQYLADLTAHYAALARTRSGSPAERIYGHLGSGVGSSPSPSPTTGSAPAGRSLSAAEAMYPHLVRRPEKRE